ncbi:SDR family NAD(P)-dependent oxidoreductase [Myxococcus sp. AM011]|uniref:SDR family NAD(P)-dependent oxidoreductase n=1 Tax=Myxococcus sp. AM011 TaxID=2745200 RepID=UPI001595388E|nr:SDR family NAD(P)-dependent oxidoreductase [Myxococcus sp. AM011]NVJ21063.1 SDR family NAD(P)-dependent oxidoreductase [Myxococcus sp. AM011]
MEQDGQGRILAERLAALSPERRALLELALKGPRAPAPRAPGPRPSMREVLQEGTEDFATLALLPEVAPSFSWLLAARGSRTDEQSRLLEDAHRDLRGALFRAVDLTTCARVLGFGGGDGREWVALARRPGTFQIIGHASSPQDVEAARERVRTRSLEGRIQVVTGGLDSEGLEAGFDVAFGLEALRHPEERASLFAALGKKVREGGRLVLGDVFLKTGLSLPHVERLSLPLLEELVGWLTTNGFLVVDCVDAAREAGNFLHEPEMDARLSQLGWGHEDARTEAARAYEVMGGLLRGGAAAYLLLTAEKRSELEPRQVEALNRERLMTVPRYADLPHTWLYAPRWRPVASGPRLEEVPSPPGHCLVFADKGGLGGALARSVDAAGGRCTFVQRGEVFRQNEDGGYEVPIRNPESFLRLTEALSAAGTVPSHVVYLWGLDVPEPEGLTVSQLQDETLDACGGILYLTQALLKAGASHPASPSLWIVTRGAQRAEDAGGLPGLLGAPLWGVGKAIAYEHPELDCRRVDVDPQRGLEEGAQALWTELRSRDEEDQVLLREGRRHVLRLARHRQWDWEGAGHLQLRADATYLVTGGLGGLGLQVARWMVERGARNLVLLGRKRASDVSAEEVREMRGRGAAIISLAGVSVDSDLDFVMAGISKSMPPLRGIIHAATEVDDGILVHQTRERLGRVFAAKVSGAWNLHRWLAGTPLDFFLSLSSSTSLMGASGQGNHLAATAFLDGLAEYRRSLGLPGQSSSWGAWAQPGDEAAAALDARMRKRGVGMVPTQQAFAILEQVFGPVPAVVGVMPIHWPTFLGGLPGDGPPPLFADFGGDAGSGRADAERRRELLRRVRGGSAEDGRSAVLEWFSERVAKVLELGATQLPESEQTLHELGLDSLMGVELKKLLHAELRVEFPLQELLGGKSVGELSGSLYEALR